MACSFTQRVVIVLAAGLFAGCGSGGNLSLGAPPDVTHRPLGHHVKRGASGCATVVDSTGKTYTAAQVGGGDQSDVEYSSTPCDIGIYISASDGPNTLDHAMVNGAFPIGVYFDNAGNAKQGHTQVCVNGSNPDGTCETGSHASPGTGIDIRNTPAISIDHTSVDGYTAGLATNPCPNQNNEFSVDHTTITNATYPWSFQGGEVKVNHDSPTPPAGGSCAGSGVGAGPPPTQVPALFVPGSHANTISAYTIDESTGALTPVNGSPFATGSGPTVPAVDSTGNFLYVINQGDATISGYAINAATGALTAVPGSPFSVGGGLYDITADPAANFLYVVDEANNEIHGYTINQNTGALTEMSGSPFATANLYPNETAVDPEGPYLYITYGPDGPGSSQSITVDSINSLTGALTPIDEGPYLGPNGFKGVISPAGQYLYAPNGDADGAGGVYAFSIGADGALSAIAGSPYAAGNAPRASGMTPSGSFLYVPNEQSQNVYGYAINAGTGALASVSGSPFSAGSNPEDFAVDPTGQFGYAVMSNDDTVWAWAINQSTGALTAIPGSPFTTSAGPSFLAIRAGTADASHRRVHKHRRH